MQKRFWLALAALAMAATWTAGLALAVDTSSNAGTLNKNEMIFCSSHLSGLNVYNRSDTNSKLGSMSNLIVDVHTGRVLFGIVHTSVGGKCIPVPWSAFQLQEDANTHQSSLTLSKTSDDLRNAPTIKKDSTFDMNDSKWLQSVDNFFGVRTVARPTESGGPGQLSTNEMIFRSSDLRGMNVYNRKDENVKLGSINDLIVDAHTGHVLFGMVCTGITGKLIPVPWNAFVLKEDANHKSCLTLSKSSDELKNAPMVDKSHMPDFTDSHWRQTVDDFFGVRTVARPPESQR